MNKPMIFAIRGALGFGLTAILVLFGLVAGGTGSIAVALIALLLAGGLGATVFLYGDAHWVQATAGFSVALVLACCMFFVTVVVVVAVNGLKGDSDWLCSAAQWSCCYAVFGGVGGSSLGLKWTLPGLVIFGLSGALAGILISSAPTSTVAVLPLFLSIGGALFGATFGWIEGDGPSPVQQPD